MVTFSAWLLIAPLSGLIVGFIVLIARMRMVDAQWRHCTRAMRNYGEDLRWILFYDSLAGLVAASVVAFFGISHPTFLVDAFNYSPLLGWAVVGAIGPFAGLTTSVFVTGSAPGSSEVSVPKGSVTKRSPDATSPPR